MEMDDEFLEVNDLDWFASCKDGFLAHFATGGKGGVPQSIRESLSEYELIYEYFYSLEECFEVEVVEENLPIFSSEVQLSRYLQSFVSMAKKGLFSHDFDGEGYKLVAKPKSGKKRSELPAEILNVICILSVDSCENV
ncbi:hypothetical protein [Pseudomonas brassicacearum]|uniref:hypothetical protein n=1 Tax=Pseudomonas brassicacearum TaxID=930166 RepID=UPI001DF9577F|nr:hypothetical protein [Pseudomonas brassicacearum]CAH0324210.1 hypothetical protein SRABI06_05725 [Pseudomonas brassicacearum]